MVELAGVSWAGIEGDTFNLDTGEQMSLSDIFKTSKEDYMNYIYDFVTKQVANNLSNTNNPVAGYMFSDAYASDGQAAIKSFDQSDFYLSKDGLVIFYPKYVLADGASGPQKFVIPYEAVSDMLAIEI